MNHASNDDQREGNAGFIIVYTFFTIWGFIIGMGTGWLLWK